jgi:hypothetical protein
MGVLAPKRYLYYPGHSYYDNIDLFDIWKLKEQTLSSGSRQQHYSCFGQSPSQPRLVTPSFLQTYICPPPRDKICRTRRSRRTKWCEPHHFRPLEPSDIQHAQVLGGGHAAIDSISERRACVLIGHDWWWWRR